MTSKLTREENVQAVFDLKAGYALGLADVEILKRVARMALAAMNSEPEYLPLDYLQGHRDGLEWASQLAEANHPETGDWLYDDPIELAKAIRKGPDMPPAQPAPVVEREPIAWLNDAYLARGVVDGEAGSEDAGPGYIPVYRHAQPAPDREQIRNDHAEWSQSTFGNVGPIGPLKHLSKEALEAAADPSDLSEWADMQFLLWDAQRRAGITDEQITQAMIEKLAVNKQREWPEPKGGEPRLHIKEQPAPVLPDGLRLALSNAGIAAPESDEMLAVTQEKYIQMLVTWVKDRKPFQSALVVPEEKTLEQISAITAERGAEYSIRDSVIAAKWWNACRAAMLNGGKS